MSWYGSHVDEWSKRFVKALLPPGACKLCIYRMRYYLQQCRTRGAQYLWKEIECSRCGLKYDPLILACQLGLRNYEIGL